MRKFELMSVPVIARSLKMLLTTVLILLGETFALASSSDSFVRDSAGRIAYIVELDPSAANAFPATAAITDRFPQFNRGQTVNLILAMESRFGFRAHRMTSWSSTSFTAYMTPAVLDAVAKDSRVAMITPDLEMVFSGDTTAVWSDTTVSGEVQGWGKRATNKLTTSSNGSTVVYVLDGGVGQHMDLPNMVEWAIPLGIPVSTFYPGTPPPIYCGPRVAVGNTCNTQQFTYMVSCYTHGTGVAGVIGAVANNGQGIQGVFPNVSIVSVSVQDGSVEGNVDFTRHCLNPGTPVSLASDIKSALDWIYNDQPNNHTGRPSVVNLSLNAKSADPNFSALKTDMQALALSSPGAFIVQSAGNDFEDSCTHAYSAQICLPLTNDGIMVVGAINNHGQPIVPLNGLPGFWEDFLPFAHDKSSNWGLGVEVWAPGENILTTVADATYISFGATRYYQDGLHAYSDIRAGSGTSFSAPHLAGLAAYYIETTTPALTSASAVETVIRSHFSNLGSFIPTGVVSGGVIQASGATINIATHDPLAVGVPRNTPYAELALSKVCFAPMFATGATGCIQLPYTGQYIDQKPNGSYLFSLARNNQAITRTVANSPIWLSMDSYGAGNNNCNLSSTLIPLGGGGQFFVGPRYYGASLSYPTVGGSVWVFSSSVCPSASVQLNN